MGSLRADRGPLQSQIDQVKADQAVGRRSKFTQADLDAARDKVEARTQELKEAQSRREVAKKELERVPVELSSKQARVEGRDAYAAS